MTVRINAYELMQVNTGFLNNLFCVLLVRQLPGLPDQLRRHWGICITHSCIPLYMNAGMGNTDTLHPNSCFCSFSIPTSKIFRIKFLLLVIIRDRGSNLYVGMRVVDSTIGKGERTCIITNSRSTKWKALALLSINMSFGSSSAL